MYTYVISTDNKQFVKIGFTRDLFSRFQSIRTSCPLTMHLEGYFFGDIEKKLLKKYSSLNVRSEWFKYEVLDKLKAEVGFMPLEHNLDITHSQIVDSHSTDVLYYLRLHSVCDKVELSQETIETICKEVLISVYYFEVCIRYLWINKRFIMPQFDTIGKAKKRVFTTKQ